MNKMVVHEKCAKCVHTCKLSFSVKVESIYCKKYEEKKEKETKKKKSTK